MHISLFPENIERRTDMLVKSLILLLFFYACVVGAKLSEYSDRVYE